MTTLLSNIPTRDMEVCEHNGQYFYTITEAGKIIHTSDKYKDSGECAAAGIKMLDALHEQAPLRCDTVWE